MSLFAAEVGRYDWLRMCEIVGSRFAIVQFDGMGTAAGPPARMIGVEAGRALASIGATATSNSTLREER